jgi:peptide/nickel transport system substrate-binding protein
MLGWTPSTVDAHDPLYNLMSTPTEKGQGTFNLGAYSNPALDEIAAKVQSETDPARRNSLIRDALKIHIDDIGHIPLHQQALSWGFSKKVTLTQLPNNAMWFGWITVSVK